MTAFANVVEEFLIYNFCIYHFCRTDQFFGENRGQQRVDRLEISSVVLQSAAGAPGALPAWPCAARRAPRLPRRPCGPGPPPRGQSHRSPSRLSPRSTCRAVLATALTPVTSGPSRAPLPSAPTEASRRTTELKRASLRC
jgi:hypothetical protein